MKKYEGEEHFEKCKYFVTLSPKLCTTRLHLHS